MVRGGEGDWWGGYRPAIVHELLSSGCSWGGTSSCVSYMEVNKGNITLSGQHKDNTLSMLEHVCSSSVYVHYMQ